MYSCAQVLENKKSRMAGFLCVLFWNECHESGDSCLFDSAGCLALVLGTKTASSAWCNLHVWRDEPSKFLGVFVINMFDVVCAVKTRFGRSFALHNRVLAPFCICKNVRTECLLLWFLRGTRFVELLVHCLCALALLVHCLIHHLLVHRA